MELILFNPWGEFQWSLEDPVSQIHSPYLQVGAPGIFVRSFNVCSDAKGRVGCGKQWEATAHIKSLVKLQPWFLSLRWKTCLWQNCSLGSCACSEGPVLGQNTLMMIHTYWYWDCIYIYRYIFTSRIFTSMKLRNLTLAVYGSYTLFKWVNINFSLYLFYPKRLVMVGKLAFCFEDCSWFGKGDYDIFPWIEK